MTRECTLLVDISANGFSRDRWSGAQCSHCFVDPLPPDVTGLPDELEVTPNGPAPRCLDPWNL